MKIRSVLAVAGVAMVVAGAAGAEPFRIPIAASCGHDAPSGDIPTRMPPTSVNYALSVRYYDHKNVLIASPLPLLGSGSISRSYNTHRTDFAVQSGNTLSAVPVCTGYAETSLVEPTSATEGNVHLAVEYAYLSPDIMARRTKPPAFTAAPIPQSVVIDKSMHMKAGDVVSFDVPGNLPVARLEVTFTAWKP